MPNGEPSILLSALEKIADVSASGDDNEKENEEVISMAGQLRLSFKEAWVVRKVFNLIFSSVVEA